VASGDIGRDPESASSAQITRHSCWLRAVVVMMIAMMTMMIHMMIHISDSFWWFTAHHNRDRWWHLFLFL